MNLSGRYRLSPEVSLRPEHFGGILYHRDLGKMYFLYSPALVNLLSSLNSGRTLGEALDHLAELNGLTRTDLAHLAAGLEKLDRMEFLDVV